MGNVKQKYDVEENMRNTKKKITFIQLQIEDKVEQEVKADKNVR